MTTIPDDVIWGSIKIAHYLGCNHHNSALQLLKDGRIKGARCIGGRWAVSRADLDRFAASWTPGKKHNGKQLGKSDKYGRENQIPHCGHPVSTWASC